MIPICSNCARLLPYIIEKKASFFAILLPAIFLTQISLSQGQSGYSGFNYDSGGGEQSNSLFYGLPYDMKPARSFSQPSQQFYPYRPNVSPFLPDGYWSPNPRRASSVRPGLNSYRSPHIFPTTKKPPAVDTRPPATGVPYVPLPTFPERKIVRPPAKGVPPFTARTRKPRPLFVPYTLPPATFPPTVRLRPGETKPPATGVPPFTPAPWATTPSTPPVREFPPYTPAPRPSARPPPGLQPPPYAPPSWVSPPGVPIPRPQPPYAPVWPATQGPTVLGYTATPAPPAFGPPQGYRPPVSQENYYPPQKPPRPPEYPPLPYSVPPRYTYTKAATPPTPVTYSPYGGIPYPPQPTKKASPPPATSPPTTPKRRPPTTVTKPPTTTKPGPPMIPNRLRGRAHVICEPDGIVFTAQTFFPFFGEVFARNRLSESKCFERYTGESTQINVTFPYRECGTPVSGARPGEVAFQVEVVINFMQVDGTVTVQSFLARCESQRIRYATEDIPRQIEEALEELNLIPIKLERKADIPDCLMRIVPESEHDHHSYGPSNKSEISGTHIGQQLRIEWSLNPPSEAYGFIINNCTVKDHLSGKEYLVIDEKGCSTDINLLGHPHYDTYHDLAIVHWHAFKVPDDSTLSITCHFHICSEIEDDDGTTNCGEIPTPPFCPNIVTAPPNSILFEIESNYLARRHTDELQVGAEVCVVDDNSFPEHCNIPTESKNNRSRKKHKNRLSTSGSSRSEKRKREMCLSRLLFSTLLSGSIVGFLVSLGIFLTCSFTGNKRKREKRFWVGPPYQCHSLRTLSGSSASLQSSMSSQNSETCSRC